MTTPDGSRAPGHGQRTGPRTGALMTGRATAVLDGHLRFIGWSEQAEALFGHRPEDVLGKAAEEVLGTTPGAAPPAGHRGARTAAEQPGAYRISAVPRRDGSVVPVALSLTPLSRGGAGTMWLVVAMDVEYLNRRAIDKAMVAGLHHESPVMLVVYDTDARVRWVNKAIEEQFGLGLEDVAGRRLREILPTGVVLTEDGRTARDVEQPIRQVLLTGDPVTDVRYRSPTRIDPCQERVWSLSYFRLHDDAGRPIGVCEAGLDITESYVARRRMALLSRASGGIGRALDVRRTAQDLAELVVPDLADAATVDLFEAVFDGQEPPHGITGCPLRRAAYHPQDAGGVATGATPSLRARCMTENAPVVAPDGHALALPLTARGVVLGAAVLARSGSTGPFDQQDVVLARELVSRTAVCVDNARRYTREHATALMLQRDLLPRALPEPSGVEIAHRYLPAVGPAGVGGDWYDVIPLSGARVGVVVGDVAGHGTGAAATMGRVRTTVAALAALDLAPDELLSRLDDLVARTGAVPSETAEPEDQALGVTCLYAIYDPVSRSCVMARAGHLPPVLVTPDGRAELVDVPAGPPLGLGGLPFESTEIQLPEGATLALYTNGLVENREVDIDVGIRALRTALGEPEDGRLQETCDSVVGVLLPQAPEDDAALLLMRVHALAEHSVATWSVVPDAGEVSKARARVRDRLLAWKVDEAALFVVELVVSELVTNAIRYGGAPVTLRLIRERGLIVEVSDGGHTSPHLRRAATEDEGGRGLFLVAQLTRRWGTRYTPTGKTIWTEVSLDPARLPETFAADLFTL